MHLRLNRYYRYGYTDKRTDYTSTAYARYITNQIGVDEFYVVLRRLESQHPGKTFWIEESKDGNSWAKLANSKYALFSED